jgi:long-chain acyl-CoA synthetase
VPAVAACAAAGLRLFTMAELQADGAAHPAPHQPPKPDDLGYLCYTSGTTGMPKGVMVLHRAAIADSSSAYTADLGLCKTDVHLSYLPLAHVFERLVQSAFLMAGARMGFYQGDTLKILEDIQELRPTIFCSVPRLYNRIYEKIMAGVEAKPAPLKALFKAALERKKSNLAELNTLTHSFFDALVFAPVAKRVGLDRVRVMLTGSAPIAPHVIEFLRLVFRARVCEGYGQTECAAAATLTAFSDQAIKGHVGGPLACNEVKLVSVAEMGYLVADRFHDRVLAPDGSVEQAGIPCLGRGEVCYRGANVFPGYYKDAEKTAEALDADGWLHSGDIGIWDSNCNLRIVDRKKNIFKLSQGEYVAAEKIEVVMMKCPRVAAAWVHGDSLHSVIVAVVVPAAENMIAWAKANGKGSLTLAQLCADADAKRAVLEDLQAVCRASKLQSFEVIKALHLEPTPWTPEDLLTPSFKIKRAEAKKHYAKVIDDMCESRCRTQGRSTFPASSLPLTPPRVTRDAPPQMRRSRAPLRA